MTAKSKPLLFPCVPPFRLRPEGYTVAYDGQDNQNNSRKQPYRISLRQPDVVDDNTQHQSYANS